MTLEFNDKNSRNSNDITSTTGGHKTEGVETVAGVEAVEQTMEPVTGVDDDTLNCCFQVMEAISKLDPEQSQVLWCMVTDFVAAKNGIPAREIINTLVPLVVDVNDMMGPFFYDRYPPAPDTPAVPASTASDSSDFLYTREQGEQWNGTQG